MSSEPRRSRNVDIWSPYEFNEEFESIERNRSQLGLGMSVMERVRRAVSTPLGKVVVAAGGLALAAGTVFGLAQIGGHGSSHEATHRVAATA